MDAVQKANAGHPGTAMALAPVAYLLYRDVLRHNPADPHWPGRDRFVLSAGHACILQYAALHLSGYDLTIDDLKQFRQWGSRTPGHPEYGHTAGVETTTGPLGQGFANGVGMAIAQRFLADRYNRPHHSIVDSLDLRDLLRRRPDGRGQQRGGVDRRPPRARPARLRLRRQPHHDRRHDLAHVHDRGQGQALRGVRLARPARRRLGGSRRAARRARRREGGGGAAVADRSPESHRVSGATRRRHRRRHTAPRSARPRSGRRRRRWASIPTRPSPSRTQCASTWRSSPSGAPSCKREWEGRLAAWAGAFPDLARGARARSARRAARGLARGAARVPGGRGGRDARRRPHRDAGAEAVHPDDGGRVGRPRRVEQDRVRGGRRLLGHARRPQHRLRHPRARDGLDRERDRARARRCSGPTARPS